jgi:phosphatidylinositol-3-phosphatase
VRAMAVLLFVFVCAVPASRAVPTAVPAFDHVVVIVFENKERGHVIGNRAAPTFNRYAKQYANLTAYYAVAHPSLPNYIALVSGSTKGITTNCTQCVVDTPSLADSLEEAGLTWRTYAQGLPYSGFTGAGFRRYAKKHNPFLYFRAIVDDAKRRNRIVPLAHLAADVRAGTLPDFSLVIPDMCHSMHDCSVGVGDAWLRRIAAPLLTQPRTAVFVLFDEGSTSIRGGGHTPALVLGSAVRQSSRYRALSGHYEVLRTIEEAWGLPLLGESARARAITGIWRERR